MSYLCVFKWSLLGVKICLSHAQIGLLEGSQKALAKPRWSPLGVKFKISDEHPRLFHMGVPPILCLYFSVTPVQIQCPFLYTGFVA